MQTALSFVFVFCLALSFVLSGMEAGLFSLSRWRIRHQARSGNKRADVLLGFLERPEHFLWTILVGNSIANVTVFSLLVFWYYQWLSPWPVVLIAALAITVVLFYGLFELLPKTVFRAFPNRLCMFMAVPFRFIFLLFKPVVAVLAAVAGDFPRGSGEARIFGHLFTSREEMRWAMQESAPGLTSEEKVMVNRVLDLQNLSVANVAVPMPQVLGVHTDTTIREVLQLARERGFTRMPVWAKQEGRSRIAGIISLRTLLYEEGIDESKTAADYMKPALFFPSDTRLETALRHMQRTGQYLAVVISADRKETAVISLQDILKAIFGEVRL